MVCHPVVHSCCVCEKAMCETCEEKKARQSETCQWCDGVVLRIDTHCMREMCV